MAEPADRPKSAERDEPPAGEQKAESSGGGSRHAPALWALGGVAVTLLVVVVLKLVDRPLRSQPAAASSSAQRQAGREAARPLSSAREQFAELYLSYLLRSYYTESKGFCRPLLRKICEALLHSELIPYRSVCDTLPNDRFVLAIGRYQHRVGLPVDGKAGPETVRMILGGDFSNRRGMEEAYCVADPRPDAGRPAAQSDAGARTAPP